MARVTHVKSARKDAGSCIICHQPILKGDSYKWTAPRSSKASRGTKRKAHEGCAFLPSHTMASDKLGRLADAQHFFDKAVSEADGVEGLIEAAETLAEEIRSVGEEYTESADNMEAGFGTSTYISDEIREKGEGCETWAEEIESAKDDIEEFDEDDAKTEAEGNVEGDFDKEADDFDEAEYDQAIEDEIERLREEHLAEQLEKVESAAQNQPF